jgi:hypothetical protein
LLYLPSTLFSATGVFSLDEEGKKPETPLLLEEELNGVGTTPTGVASGDFSSKASSQILDANVLFFIAPLSHRHRYRHAPVHHHQETLFGSIDEPIDAIIRGAIGNDAVDTRVFVDEEGKKPEPPLLLEEELKNGVGTSVMAEFISSGQ